MLLPELAAERDGSHHLRAGHHGHGEQFDVVIRRDAVHGGACLRVEVAVDDDVVLDAFEHRGDRKDRQRKPAILRLDGFRMEQDDH